MITASWLAACAPRLPSATLDGVTLTDVGFTEARAEVRVAVDNPLWADLPTTGLRWTFEIDGHRVAGGDRADLGPIGADAVTVVPIPLVVPYGEVLAAVRTDAADVPYRFSVELDLSGRFGEITLPVEHVGTMPRPAPPSLDLVDVGFGRDGTAVLVDLALDLGLPEGTSIEALRWTAAVDEWTLGSGSASLTGRRLALPMRVELSSAAAVSLQALLGRTSALHLRLDGELGTPLGVVPISWARDLPTGQ